MMCAGFILVKILRFRKIRGIFLGKMQLRNLREVLSFLINLSKMMKNNQIRFYQIILSSEFLLLLATLLALWVANYGDFELYQEIFKTPLPFFSQELNAKFFIDDCLMVIFFVLLGFELKKEIVFGELSSKEKLLLPMLAALGGVVLPALIYFNINLHNPQNIRGFAIPTVTDIVFTYAIIKAFGNKIPNALKVFIVTLAVADDLVAIVIIALFYTKKLQIFYLCLASFMTLILAILNVCKEKKLRYYILCGLFLWYCIMQCGIHPTIAGVIFAMFIPYQIKDKFLLQGMAHSIAPFVNFVVLPLFAFANAGVKIVHFDLMTMLDPLIIGIAAGLFFGKQFGIFSTSYILIKSGICVMPKKSNWLEFYGVSILAGIGFTMSLFIGNLAFSEDEFLDKIRIGVLFGSCLSLIVGSLFLLIVTYKRKV